MVQDSFDVHEGMEVYGSDGEKIGKVTHIFSAAAFTDTLGNASADAEPTTAYGSGGTANSIASSGDFGVGNSDGSDETTASVGAGGALTIGGSTDSGFAGGFNSGSSGGPLQRLGSAGVSSQSESAAAGSASLTPSDTKYLEVHHGGVLGMGGDNLYVPFSAVQAVTNGESLTIHCSSHEAVHLFDQKPETVDVPG
ncbi:MAG: hypothetical protein NVSMB52_17790 [Chloroflexota bacterium]